MKQYVNEYDEALGALTSGMLDTSDIEPYMGAIVRALKKQIPEKTELMALASNMKQWCRYCEDCGQLLDWEE